MSHPVIVDLFEAIVSDVSAAMGETVYYHHGHMLEISDIVRQMTVDPDVSKRYPIIALRHDITQKYIPVKGVEFDCTLYLITLSRPEYIAPQRMETIFKPLLYPLKEELINHIARSKYFEQQTTEEVEAVTEWIDRLFWGRAQVMGNDSNIFGDWVDAIELNIKGLTAFETCSNGFLTGAPKIINAYTGILGRYIYLIFNRDMADVSGVEPGSIDYVHGIAEATPTAILNGGTGKVIILDLGASLIEPDEAVTVTIPTGMLESTYGVNYPGCTSLTVVNNVQ